MALAMYRRANRHACTKMYRVYTCSSIIRKCQGWGGGGGGRGRGGGGGKSEQTGREVEQDTIENL